ncbi:S-layer homology domain-containing protein [Paenibacillus sp. SI8]|uniref:S-layer homology domain-containing protein n=1 Tax=unclassified Paenibacillus TaxID=185978 RepID=UPI0034674F5E
MSADQGTNGSFTGEAVDLANKVDDEIDVIFAAHNHKRVNTTIDGKLVVAAWEYSKALMDVDLEIDRTTGDVVSKKGQILYNFRTVTPDTDVQTIIDDYNVKAGPKLKEIVGTNVNAMVQNYPGKGTGINNDFPLGNLIADAMKAELNADFAMMNGGGVRAPLNEGSITWEELFSIQPFSNTLIRVEVTGAELKEIVEAQLGTNPMYGPDSHVGGFRYTWTQVGTKRKVIDLTFPDGTPIPANGTYTLVVNSFMYTSNDARYIKMHTLGKNALQGPEDLQATVKFVKNHQGPIDYVSEGRIREIVAPASITTGEKIQLSGSPVNIVVPSGVTGTSVQVTTATYGSNKQATVPSVEVKAITSIGDVSVKIPNGATITAPLNWDGTIKLPEVLPNNSVTVNNGTVAAVIEIGSPNVTLTFDKAVRLLIPNQAGKKAGFIRSGIFTPITNTVSADSQEAADKEIAAGGEAKIDVGSDLVIWTKHFTQFVSYTSSNSQSDYHSSGSGTSSATSGLAITASAGGTVELNGAKIAIPAGAMKSDAKVTVEKVTNTADLVKDSTFKLVSDVFEIKKDAEGEFTKDVTITLPFDKTKTDLAKSTVSIYWFDESSEKWMELDNPKVDADQAIVTGSVKHFTKFAILAKNKGQSSTQGAEPASLELSDIKGHWAETNIRELIKSGAIDGYPKGTFSPEKSITRAEFASVLVKAFKLQEKSGKGFADTANHWAKKSIETAAAYEIVSGYSVSTFGPDDLITREQMAVMIAKAAKLPAASSNKTFADSAEISDWAKASVASAVANSIVNGYENGAFKPNANATRAEAVTVIVKALKK